jgi:hypothetical protein
MKSRKQIDIEMMGRKLRGYVCSGQSSSYTEIGTGKSTQD